MQRRVGVAVGTLFLAASLAAQQPAVTPKVETTIDVPVTNVDIVVTDAKGNRVAGLTKADFHILDRNEEREITNFSELRAAAAGESATTITPRLILLVFDNMSLSLSARNVLVPAARAFLTDVVRPGDRVMIATAGHSLERLTNWTSDRVTIEAALHQVATEAKTLGTAVDRNAAEARIAQVIRDWQTGGERSPISFDTLVSTARQQASDEMRDATQSIAAMSSALGLFTRGPGRKVLVIAGSGLPLKPGADIFQHLENLRFQAQMGNGPALPRAANSSTTTFGEASSFDLQPKLEAFANVAFQKGVAIYGIDPELGQKASGDVEQRGFGGGDTSFSATGNRMAGYQLLANRTGGQAILGRSPQETLALIAADLGTYYSLGFRSGGKSVDAPGQLVVRTKPGLKVRTILAGAPLPREMEVKELVLANQIEATGGNDLDIALATDPPIADGTKRKVTLKVMIPVRRLKLANEGNVVTGGFHVFVTTGDGRGSASDVNKQTHEIRWPAEALPQLIDKRVTFVVPVVLEEGRNQISVGVMDVKSEAAGYERITVK